MAVESGKIDLDTAVELVFNYTATTISELKSRKWSATTLAVAAIIGIDTFGARKAQGCRTNGSQASRH